MPRFECKRCGMTFRFIRPIFRKNEEELRCECGIAYGCCNAAPRKTTCWVIRYGKLPGGVNVIA